MFTQGHLSEFGCNSCKCLYVVTDGLFSVIEVTCVSTEVNMMRTTIEPKMMQKEEKKENSNQDKSS